MIEQDKLSELNAFQKSGRFHPYTCDRNHAECEVNITPRDYSKDGILIATSEGWVCPCGKYTQPISQRTFENIPEPNDLSILQQNQSPEQRIEELESMLERLTEENKRLKDQQFGHLKSLHTNY